jgi:hypothetical protein
MEPRSLNRIANPPKARRLEVIAEGLDLLTEHVETLRGDQMHLVEEDRRRAAAVVNAVATEEAAKVVILLDLVRTGWVNSDAVKRQIGRFYDHMARGLYARLTAGRPQDLKEIRGYADVLRRSRYLDGPNEVDWIFRNEIQADREDSLYVDYVAAEDQCFWTTPAIREEYSLRSPIIDLAIALKRVGATSVKGLKIIADAWHGVVISDDTHWQIVEAINRKIVGQLYENGLTQQDLNVDDVRCVYEQWTFPLIGVELKVAKMSLATLQEERDQWLRAQWGDYF